MLEAHYLSMTYNFVVEGAKGISSDSLDVVIKTNRHRFDSSFLSHLRDEKLQLTGSPLCALLATIEERVRSEISMMTKEDIEAIAAVLEEGRVNGYDAEVLASQRLFSRFVSCKLLDLIVFE